MKRRSFMKAAALGLASAAIGGCALPQEKGSNPKKPNILMILVDDLGYGGLSSYGCNYVQTPKIDSLCQRGMRFTEFYANCPVCSPTRAALLSGRNPDAVGVPGVIRTYRDGNWGYLSPDAVLLPKVLKSAGYETSIIGKWHLGLKSPNKPNDRGFDHFHGFLGDMMDDYWHHRRYGINYMRLNETEIDPKGHATDLFTQWAIDHIEEKSSSDKPFFMYLAYNAPHRPINPPKDWVEKVRRRDPKLSKDKVEMAALIEHMDDGIGKVVESLDRFGIAENTLVIFASDNGAISQIGGDNGNLRGDKQDMYEGGIKVPMCAVWPGKIKPSTESGFVSQTMDLFPTICRAAGAEITHKIDGISILPVLFGQPEPKNDRFLFWVRREGGLKYGGRDYYAVRQGDYKLLQNTPFEPMQLYNLKDDPQEQKPLSSEHPIYKKLFNALRNHVNKNGRVPWQRP